MSPFRPVLAAVILVAVAGILGAGCIFDPPKDNTKIIKPPAPSPYPRRDSPARAIYYLKAAWENRDSTRVDTLYATNYVGTSFDSSDPNPATLTFGRDDEIRALGAVQQDQNVTRVLMQFNDSTTWIHQAYPLDPPSWYAFVIPSPKIEVDVSVGNSWVADASKTFEFKMAPQVVAPNDTLWQIVRWTETQ